MKAKGDGLFGTNRTFTVTFSNPTGRNLRLWRERAGDRNDHRVRRSAGDGLLGPTCVGGTVNGGGVATFLILLAGAHPADDASGVGRLHDGRRHDDHRRLCADLGHGRDPASASVSSTSTCRRTPTRRRATGHSTFSCPTRRTCRLQQNSASCTIHSTTARRRGRRPGVDHDHRPGAGHRADERHRAGQRPALADPAEPAAVEPGARVRALADAGRHRDRRRDRLHRSLRGHHLAGGDERLEPDAGHDLDQPRPGRDRPDLVHGRLHLGRTRPSSAAARRRSRSCRRGRRVPLLSIADASVAEARRARCRWSSR